MTNVTNYEINETWPLNAPKLLQKITIMSDVKKSIDQILLEIWMSRKTKPKSHSVDFARRRVVEIVGDDFSKESVVRALEILETRSPEQFSNAGEMEKTLSAYELLESANRKIALDFKAREPHPAKIELTDKERKQIEDGKLNVDQLHELANAKIAEARKK